MRTIASILLILTAAVVPARADAPDDGAALAAQRAEFEQAYAAIGQPGSGADSAALKAYPLYPYLQAARLEHAVLHDATSAAQDRAVAAFLAAHGDEPVSHDLRRIWLVNLAERRQWASFLLHFQADDGDQDLQCDALAAQVALGRTRGLPERIEKAWLNPQSMPRSCDPAFDWMRRTHRLGAALIEQRARLALNAGNSGLARTLAKDLPAARAAPLLRWAELIEHPQQAIDRFIAKPDPAVEPAALLDGWSRLARTDPDAAMQRYDALLRARGLQGRSASPYARALALGLAWDRRPEALQYFSRIDPADVDTSVIEWTARAALWAGDWAQVARAIVALPPDAQRQLRWQYFSARAEEQLQHAGDAHARYLQLAGENGYYAALAAARAGRDYAPHPQLIPFDEALIAQLAQRPDLVRARELYFCGLLPEATREWLAAYGRIDPGQRMQLVALAHRWGWYDQAVATASRAGFYEDYALLYPRPYRAGVNAGSQLTGLDSDLIYGVMRQESLYRADVMSPAGALGLLQLVPETARRVARRWDQPVPDRGDLLDPAVNLILGAAELRDLKDALGGRTALALAAYNAGPNAVQRWLPPQPLAADIWIENIPYNETRGYVQRVMWHSLVFAWEGSGRPQSTRDWLAPIQAPAQEAAR